MLQEQTFQFYERTRDYYRAYEQHKELSAWAGLVLLFIFDGIVLDVRLPRDPCNYALLVATFVVSSVTFLVYRFVNIQIKLKARGRVLQGAAWQICLEISQENPDNFDVLKYLQGRDAAGKHLISDHVCPKILLDRADALEKLGPGPSKSAERIVYWLMFISWFATVSMIVLSAYLAMVRP